MTSNFTRQDFDVVWPLLAIFVDGKIMRDLGVCVCVCEDGYFVEYKCLKSEPIIIINISNGYMMDGNLIVLVGYDFF